MKSNHKVKVSKIWTNKAFHLRVRSAKMILKIQLRLPVVIISVKNALSINSRATQTASSVKSKLRAFLIQLRNFKIG